MKYAVEMVSGGMIYVYVHTKFQDDPLGHSSNMKVVTSTIYEATLLVLLMGGIYEVGR
jgi:hypothetical protein